MLEVLKVLSLLPVLRGTRKGICFADGLVEHGKHLSLSEPQPGQLEDMATPDLAVFVPFARSWSFLKYLMHRPSIEPCVS